MSEQSVTALAQRLNCAAQDIGFLDYLPEATQSELAQSITAKLDDDEHALAQASAAGIKAMPAWLGFIAGLLVK